VDGSLGATALTVANTATLAGAGILAAAPTFQSGSTLAPGDSGIGTLMVNASLTLAASTVMELSKTGSSLTNDVTRGCDSWMCRQRIGYQPYPPPYHKKSTGLH
jgi:hypothetical protein